MTHLDDGTLQAFLDDELAPADRASVAEHLLACDRCQHAHESLTRANALVTQSASVLDVAPTAPVRRRTSGHEGRAQQSRGRTRLAAVGRAAVLVIATAAVAAAAAAAVPGTPVHDWVTRALAPSDTEPPVAPSAPPPAPAVASGPDGVVEGVVRGSSDRERLPYARVQVVGDTIADWTDERGEYRLEGVRRGPRTIQVMHPGHDTLAVAATIADERPVRLDVTLEPRPGPQRDALADFEPIRVEFTLPALLNGAEVAALLHRMYPTDLARAPFDGEAVLRLWLDETGQVVRSAIASSSGHRALDSIALIVADSMRFRPARREQDGVRVIVQMPLTFLAPDPALGSVEPAGQRR